MHGLVFVTWEKYLQERFDGSVLSQYREKLGLNATNSPLAVRTYPDELLLKGVGTAHEITGVAVDTLLQEYGRYFIANGLTRHRCAYLLSQSHNGRDLLLAMRDAHEQMQQLPDGLTPPLFEYRFHPQNAETMALIYDSERHLCPLLFGAIQGAAAYYGEQVEISEGSCMRSGDRVCTFYVKFSGTPTMHEDTPGLQAHRQEQQHYADQIFALLPVHYGLTLAEIQEQVIQRGASKQQSRPALILQALNHLHHAGLVASSANEEGDEFSHRRYWRVPLLPERHS
jgi:hypothetical protein